MQERVILWWKGDYYFLDNSFETPILFKNVTYPSVTHAFMAAQTEKLDLRIKIAHAPLIALKHLMEEVQQPYDGFQGPDTMRILLETKFGLSAAFAEMSENQSRLAMQLITTGRKALVYGNHVCNQFWGDCQCDNHYNEKGKNVAGGLLMGIRDKLVEHLSKGISMKQTCVDGAVVEAFFMYPLNGKLWLKGFCSSCQSKAARLAISCSQTKGIYRFEKDWIKDKKEPVNEIIVPRRHLIRPDVFNFGHDEDAWERNWMGISHPRIPVIADPGPKMPKNKTFYLSGRVS